MKTVVFAALLMLPVSAVAQSVTTAAAAPEATPVPTIAVGTRVGDLPTGYEDGGRRDPFASLVVSKRTASATADGRPRTGLGAMSLADVTVKGLVKSGSTMLAILEVPGKQSFVARVKDRLLDATVQSIDAAGVVFAEHAGSGTPTQVRKALRATGEEGR